MPSVSTRQASPLRSIKSTIFLPLASAGTMANIDVQDANNGQIIAQHAVQAADLASSNQWTRITVPISVTNTSNSLEFRLWWYGTANMDAAFIQVR